MLFLYEYLGLIASLSIIPASNAKACYATGRGVQARGIRVNDIAVFYVHTKGAGEGEVAVQIFGPGECFIWQIIIVYFYSETFKKRSHS